MRVSSVREDQSLAASAEPDLVAFSAALHGSTTGAKCLRAFRDLLQPYKIVTFASGEIDLAARQRSVFHTIEWPKPWRDYYLKERLFERDPVLGALASRKGPFTWTHLRADNSMSELGRKTLDRLVEHGWTDGLVVPIPRGGTRFGLVSLVCYGRKLEANDLPGLTSAAVMFHERIRPLVMAEGFPAPPAGLTQREIECLALIGSGMSDREIGESLGIATGTAHEHFENAKRKIKAKSRAHAVALAVSLGIIAP